MTLHCPTEGNKDRIAYCNQPYPKGYRTTVPVNQGIFVYDIQSHQTWLIRERVKAGLRRAKLEGRRIGRPEVQSDRDSVLEDRAQGLSLNELARKYQVSKASIRRALKLASKRGCHKTLPQAPL